jgi:hypothetical protein
MIVKRIAEKIKALLRRAVGSLAAAMVVVLAFFMIPALYFLAKASAETANRFWAGPGIFFSSGANRLAVLAWAVCVVGGGLVAWLVFSNRLLIWAVARKMIVEALNRKVAVVLLVFLLILIPSLPFILKTEGNPKSQIQITLTYALGLGQLLLSVLAVCLCTASVCGEIDGRQIQVTDTKPLPRWQYLTGKLLGVMILCSTLLFLMALSIGVLLYILMATRNVSDLPPGDRQMVLVGLMQARVEVLVTRRNLRPAVPDFREIVDKNIKERTEKGEFADASALRSKHRELTNQLRSNYMSVPPMQGRIWRIEGLSVRPAEPVFVHFKIERLSDEGPPSVYARWQFFHEAPGEQAKGTSASEGPSLALVYQTGWARHPLNAVQDIPVPGGVVSPTGMLYIGLQNAEPGLTVYMSPDEGLEVLQRTEGFLPNYYRALLVILCHILLLSAISIMAGAALSFPVASITVAGIFVAGLLSPWVVSETANKHDVWSFFVRGVCYAVPHVGRFSSIGDLVNGRAVTWAFVGKAMAALGFLWGGGAMLLASYFYYRRELARVIV